MNEITRKNDVKYFFFLLDQITFGLGSIYLSTNYSSSPKHWFYVLLVYTLLVNPISKGGIWKLLELRKNETRTIELAKQLKETLRVLLKK
jgi:hypothetical protein